MTAKFFDTKMVSRGVSSELSSQPPSPWKDNEKKECKDHIFLQVLVHPLLSVNKPTQLQSIRRCHQVSDLLGSREKLNHARVCLLLPLPCHLPPFPLACHFVFFIQAHLVKMRLSLLAVIALALIVGHVVCANENEGEKEGSLRQAQRSMKDTPFLQDQAHIFVPKGMHASSYALVQLSAHAHPIALARMHTLAPHPTTFQTLRHPTQTTSGSTAHPHVRTHSCILTHARQMHAHTGEVVADWTQLPFSDQVLQAVIGAAEDEM